MCENSPLLNIKTLKEAFDIVVVYLYHELRPNFTHCPNKQILNQSYKEKQYSNLLNIVVDEFKVTYRHQNTVTDLILLSLLLTMVTIDQLPLSSENCMLTANYSNTRPMS